MEYVIGAIAGAVIFAAGFFVALKTIKNHSEHVDGLINEVAEEGMDEEMKKYLEQFDNFMSYTGRAQK